MNILLSHSTWFLDSLVVRISACHVEGPGSIPGRGETFSTFRTRTFFLIWATDHWSHITFIALDPKVRHRQDGREV